MLYIAVLRLVTLCDVLAIIWCAANACLFRQDGLKPQNKENVICIHLSSGIRNRGPMFLSSRISLKPLEVCG